MINKSDTSQKKQSNAMLGSVILLIIDKKAHSYSVVASALNDLGMKNIIDCKNPSTAVSLIIHPYPAMVVMDWEAAPFYQSAEFLQKVRKTEKVRGIPVILVAEALSEELLAIAGEYDIEKIFLKHAIRSNFKIDMVHFIEEMDTLPAFKKLLQKLDEVTAIKNQAEIDTTISQLYKMEPTHPRVQIEYGAMLVRNGKLDEAEKLAEKAVKSAQGGTNVRAKNLLSRIYLKKGKLAEAVELLRSADVLSPNNIERLVLMGDCYFGLGEQSTAKLKYEAALEIEPNSPGARKGLGIIQLTEGEINKALSLFHQTTSEEELAAMFNTAAVIAVKDRNFDRAVQLYEAAKRPIKSNDILAKVCFNMGLAYRKWQKFDLAEHWFREALDLEPGFAKASRNLEETLAESGSVDAMAPASAPFDTLIESDDFELPLEGPLTPAHTDVPKSPLQQAADPFKLPEPKFNQIPEPKSAPKKPFTAPVIQSKSAAAPPNPTPGQKPYAYGAAVFDSQKKNNPKNTPVKDENVSSKPKIMDEEEDF